jgi:hypothetical protein
VTSAYNSIDTISKQEVRTCYEEFLRCPRGIDKSRGTGSGNPSDDVANYKVPEGRNRR